MGPPFRKTRSVVIVLQYEIAAIPGQRIMIIWGTTHLKSVVDSGVFNCPQCQSEVPYTRKKATEYFTLYFIPLFPLGARGRFIECNICNGTYTEEILSYDPDAEKVANQAAVFRILIAFMVHFRKTGVPHVQACQAAYSQLLDQDVPAEIVEKELQLALQPGSSPDAYIRSEGATFATEAKLQILASAKNILTAESADEEHVRMIMTQFCDLLGLPKEDFEQIYEVVNELAKHS